MRASTVCHCGGGLQFAATHCGGLRNCTCTSNKSSLHSSRSSGHWKRSSTGNSPRSVQLISGSRLVRGLAPVFMASRSIAYSRPLGVWPFISSASRRHGRSWRGAERRGAGLAAARARWRTVRRQPYGPGFCPQGVLARRLRRRKRRSLHRPRARSIRSASWRQARWRTSASDQRRTSVPAAGGTVSAAAFSPSQSRRLSRMRRSPHSPTHVVCGKNATGHAERCGRVQTCAPPLSSASATAGRLFARNWRASRSCNGRGPRGRWTKQVPRSTSIDRRSS